MKVKVRKFIALRMAGGSWDNTVTAVEVQYIVPIDDVKLYTFTQALEELGIRNEVVEIRNLEEGMEAEEIRQVEERLSSLLSQYLQRADIEIVEESTEVIKVTEPLPKGSVRWEKDKKYYIIVARDGIKERIQKVIDEIRITEEKEESYISDSPSAQEKLAKAILGETKSDSPGIPINTVLQNPGYAEIPRGYRVIRFAPDLVAVVPEGQSIVTLSCSKNLMGRVIGKGGQTIRSVQEKYKIRINLKEA